MQGRKRISPINIVYTVGSNAFPRQVRERGIFDIPPPFSLIEVIFKNKDILKFKNVVL